MTARPGAAGQSDAKAPAAGQRPAPEAGQKAQSAQAVGRQPRAAVAPPPYEQARDELIDLVKRLESGGLTLAQSLELWERGERLAAVCEQWLEGARARLAAATAQQPDDGAPATPF